MNTETIKRPAHILIVEDDATQAKTLQFVLDKEGHQTCVATNASEMRSYLERRAPELVLLDLHLPDANGLDLIPEIVSEEMISVVVITAQSEIDTVVEAMRRGADHFFKKPVDLEQLVTTIQSVLIRFRQQRQVLVYHDRIRSTVQTDDQPLPELIGSSDAMTRVRAQALKVAPTDAAVVLLGESGTGKGVMARGIHRLSQRAAAPFVDLNCASLQPQLLESEIFGHEKGAFTGAASRKPGLMEVANNGSLFLDEVIELDLQAQSKLLKAIEQGTFRRVGGIKELSVDVRFITATQRDLAAIAKSGGFRADLYYRLNVFEITIPPLRERLGDVLELAVHFIDNLNPVLGREVEQVTPRVLERLRRYPWPGNVRELRNVIERAMILVTGAELDVEHLPGNLLKGSSPPQKTGRQLRTLEEMEAEHILEVLRELDFNIQGTARALGIARSALYNKMKRHGIERDSAAHAGPATNGLA